MRQRLRQLREAGREPGPEHLAVAREWLGGGVLYDLWAGQTPRDMVHSAETALWLLGRGHADVYLLQAALVHDIGKGRQRTADRVLFVVADAVGLAGAAARADSRLEVRRALARTLGHSDSGAVLLEGAGAAAEVVRLTRLHHSRAEGNGMLKLLQEADAAS